MFRTAAPGTLSRRHAELPWRQGSLAATALMVLWFSSGRPLRRRRAAAAP